VRDVAGSSHSLHPGRSDIAERNRRTARALLAILSVLAVATLLAGIRW
jgi:hypothetical protein